MRKAIESPVPVALQEAYAAIVCVIAGRWVRSPVEGDPQILLRSPDGNRGFLCESRGLGFMLDSQGWVVTCAHCVLYREADEVMLATKGGKPWSSSVKSIIVSHDVDVALLEASQAFEGPPFWMAGRHPVAVGDEVFFWTPIFREWDGGRQTVDLCLRHTIVSAIHEKHWEGREATRFLIDSTVPPGSSGSPLFLRDGGVIGMVYQEEMNESGYVALPTGVGRAIPIETIEKELAKLAADHRLRITRSN